MTSKKLGALLKSVPPATARAAPEIIPVSAVEKPAPAPRRAVLPAAKKEPEVPLQVLVPAHIRQELGIMVAKERTSLRSLILRGIRGLGIEVTAEEIKGKRGRRHSF
ncbi:MAG TPA: hypothetical protein VM910_40050 [Bradyrhizobium sp.]|jgi:hypothetical protein|nr:hypothetical protein [Bradyrhizobium sp.]